MTAGFDDYLKPAGFASETRDLAAVHGRYIWQVLGRSHTYSTNKSRLNRHCLQADKKATAFVHSD